MGRPRKRPAEFPTDWHWERHLEDLERELAGRKNRLAELQSLEPVNDEAVAVTESEIAAVEKELARYGKGQQTASKRPAKAAETR